jgi:mono/diheme cytochrome c family protein
VQAPPQGSSILINPLTRRGLGAWKLVGFDTTPWQPDSSQSAAWNLGSYLVNGPGHCVECHTPRNLLMVPDRSRHLAGGPHPEGSGKVPSIRDLQGRKRYRDIKDLVSAFQLGELGGYDKMSAAGMGSVQTNLSKLPESDLIAIATYLMSLK